jgi:ferredoxin
VAYAIGLPCVDVTDLARMQECPVDCIEEGGRMLDINPNECVDGGAWAPVCLVEAR